MAKNLYFKQTATGTGDFLTAANAGSAANFDNAANWGAGANQISPGDTVYIIGAFTTRLVVNASGVSASSRTRIVGDGVVSSLGFSPSWSGTTSLPGINFGSFSFLALHNCELFQTSSGNNYDCVSLNGSSDNLIQGNYIHTTFQGGVGYVNGTLNHRNEIRGNWFYDIGNIGGGSQSPVVINVSGNANLAEYNAVGLSLDRIRFFGTGNVARNNYLGTTDTVFYPNTSQYPNHTDGFQSFDPGPLVQFLYEANYDTDNKDSAVGGPNAHLFLVQDQPGTNGFTWHINRFNLGIRPGGGGPDWQNTSHVYVYNNTFVALNNQLGGTYGGCLAFTYPNTHTAGTSDLVDVRNISLVYSPNTLGNNSSGSSGPIEYLPTNYSGGTLHMFNASGTQANYPTVASSPLNLLHVAPQFVDGTGVLGHDNYMLSSGSPLRATGSGYLTAVGAAVGSSSLTVSNAQYLFDGTSASGWPVADGDWIKIGTGSYVQVVSINYSTNVATLASPRTWLNGDTVIVKGQEDVGALPFSYAAVVTNSLDNSSLASGVNSLTSTVNNTDAVRKVEYLVDGLPVGTSYTSPYTIAYTSDGGTHVVSSLAYSRWTSATPITVSTKTLGPTSPIGSNVTNRVILRGMASVSAGF